MCTSPKAPRAAPSVIDATQTAREDRSLRRRRRGYLGTFKSGMGGDRSAGMVAAKELTGQ